MFGGEETKSLAAWRLELKKYGRQHWLKFYEEVLGRKVSRISPFYKALKNYGEWHMMDAITATANASLTGDPLAYVLKVAQNMWKEEQKALDTDEETEAKIKRSIEETRQRNEELQKRLTRRHEDDIVSK